MAQWAAVPESAQNVRHASRQTNPPLRRTAKFANVFSLSADPFDVEGQTWRRIGSCLEPFARRDAFKQFKQALQRDSYRISWFAKHHIRARLLFGQALESPSVRLGNDRLMGGPRH
jgi:hypothetical protein